MKDNAESPVFPPKGPIGGIIYTGLTKRELFAAMAMQGIYSGGKESMGSLIKASAYACENIAEFSAGMAVECADALIAELGKGES